MNLEMIIYAIVGLALLYLIINLLKWPIKLLINGIGGVILLYIANFIGQYFNFSIIINHSRSNIFSNFSNVFLIEIGNLQ